MTGNEYDDLTIDGRRIIRSQSGEFSGDILYQTADGRWWRKLDGGIPGTLGTSDVIRTIKSNGTK